MALQGDLETIVEDGDVRFRFEIANSGEEAEEITFRDAGKADFVVYEGGSEPSPDCEHEDEREERWRWSKGRTFAQVLETNRLEPGASSGYEGRWESPDPGEYLARATLRAPDRDLEATCTFSIAN